MQIQSTLLVLAAIFMAGTNALNMYVISDANRLPLLPSTDMDSMIVPVKQSQSPPAAMDSLTVMWMRPRLSLRAKPTARARASLSKMEVTGTLSANA